MMNRPNDDIFNVILVRPQKEYKQRYDGHD